MPSARPTGSVGPLYRKCGKPEAACSITISSRFVTCEAEVTSIESMAMGEVTGSIPARSTYHFQQLSWFLRAPFLSKNQTAWFPPPPLMASRTRAPTSDERYTGRSPRNLDTDTCGLSDLPEGRHNVGRILTGC